MSPWYRVFIYLICLPWDLLTWPMILLIRLFWGTNLGWEKAPEQGTPSLAVDLKPDSWPCRTWYTYKVNKKKVENHPSKQAVYGKYRTWGGTTLGPHAFFYGPGRRVEGEWSPVQHHEHRHGEQGEAYMLGALMYATPVFIHSMIYGNLLWVMSLVMWTLGYVSMIANFFIAFLRGESGYRGSHHEEAAYESEQLFRQRNRG